MSKPIRISIVEDNEGLRSSVRLLLEASEGFACLADYPNGRTALADIPVHPPDLVLMDINLPDVSGIECVRQLKAKLPQLRIVMFTVYDDSEQLFQSLTAGADGYLLKRTPRAKLLDSIREVFEGGAPMSRQMARMVVGYFHKMNQAALDHPAAAPAPAVQHLTPREQDILANLAKGYTYKEIANALSISNDTVRNHMRSIYEKLHVHTRTEAILRYLGR